MSCNFSQEGYAQTVQFLLDKGAVINAQDKNGRTGNVSMSFLFWILVFYIQVLLLFGEFCGRL